ncbi:MAG: DUF4372 domain-containing protein [Bacteroidales bacterium]|nr:DUF4372 domain-containing protein [Bacteroidales bacterium]
MLYGILRHFDSLRKLECGMEAEVHKLKHLGLDYMFKRSTLAEADKLKGVGWRPKSGKKKALVG